MLLSAVSVLVVAQTSSEIPEGLMNNPVFTLKEGGDCSETSQYSALVWAGLPV